MNDNESGEEIPVPVTCSGGIKLNLGIRIGPAPAQEAGEDDV